jgi:tetratricopeptide (TPR) repeat protein
MMSAFAVFVAIMLFHSVLYAQLNIRRINFLILDTENKPVQGAIVRITSPDQKGFNLEENTNKKGVAVVTLISTVKNIYVEVESEGYQSLKTKNTIKPPLGTTDKRYTLFRLGELTPEQKKEAAEKKWKAKMHFEKGVELFGEKDFEECIEEFNKALEYNPDWLEVYQNLAGAYFSLENYEEAIKYAKKTLEIDPELALSIRLLMVAYSKLGDEETARKYEDQYRKMEGVEISGEEHFNMGAVAANEGNDEKALGHFRKAVEVKPEFADGHYQLALCLIRLGRSDEALPSLEKYLELAPEGKEAGNAKALLQAFKQQ